MEDILNFLVKYKIISLTNQEDKIAHLCTSPAYLVGKPDKTVAYPLIIDFWFANKTLLCPLPVIPDITSVLHTLQNQHICSTMDLSSAFFSVKLHPDFKYVTRFATPVGSFQFDRLPMGLSTSPQIFS